MGDKPQFIKPIGVYERDTRCLAPVNVRSLFPPIEEDFGLYISSGTDQAAHVCGLICNLVCNLRADI